jgi:23S rRNA (cytosine1962-C5)-methyltransferase
MNNETLPVIRLKPKANARAIRHGFPWVFDNEIVTDRRTKALAPGSIARLEDGERHPMGLIAVNPGSRIFGRMLDRDPDAVIDGAWLRARLAAALEHRTRLYDQPFYRLAHA